MLIRTNSINQDKLSILGFGCMRLPTKNGGIDEIRSISMIHEAIEAGGELF